MDKPEMTENKYLEDYFDGWINLLDKLIDKFDKKFLEWPNYKEISISIRNWKIPRKHSNTGFESERKDNKRSWWRLDSEYKKPESNNNDRPIAYIR